MLYYEYVHWNSSNLRKVKNGQPEEKTAEKDRQAQAEKAAEVHASQEEVMTSVGRHLRRLTSAGVFFALFIPGRGSCYSEILFSRHSAISASITGR